MKLSKYIADEIHKLGVRHVFGYQGGNIINIVDAISAHDELYYIQTSHEQGAAFAANGYAQSRGGIGVAISSSGPGALNLVTGVANAYFDSIPVLFISGDLSHRYKKNILPLRQDGFQSTDIVSIVKPITKYAEIVNKPDEIRYILLRAFFEMTTGRKGPVYISIPHWIQGAEIEPSTLITFLPKKTKYISVSNLLHNKVSDVMKCACRPMLLIGGGCTDLETKQALRVFIDYNKVPIVASLCGLSVVPHDHPSYIGFIGDYGNRHANLAVANSDCLVIIGARMDERQVGMLKAYKDNKKIIHVDIDPSELYPYSECYIPVNESALNFMSYYNEICFDENSLAEWSMRLLQLKKKYPVLPQTKDFTVSGFLHSVSSQLLYNAQIYVDVGLHQMCCAQALKLSQQQSLFVSGGLGSMGYALPASIGGYLASPEKQTICICGDGGILMSLNELQTISRENINVKIIVINNNCLGMIRQYQLKAFEGRTTGSVEGYQPCDLAKIAHAFDLLYYKISDNCSFDNLFELFISDGPALIEVVFSVDMAPFPSQTDYSFDN